VDRRFEQTDHQAAVDILFPGQAAGIDLPDLLQQLTPTVELLLETLRRNVVQSEWAIGFVILSLAFEIGVLPDERLECSRCRRGCDSGRRLLLLLLAASAKSHRDRSERRADQCVLHAQHHSPCRRPIADAW
jgi:hypothetical protein